MIYGAGTACAKALGWEGGCQRDEGRALGQSVMRREHEGLGKEQPDPAGLTALAGRAGITQGSPSSPEGFEVREEPDQSGDLRSFSGFSVEDGRRAGGSVKR